MQSLQLAGEHLYFLDLFPRQLYTTDLLDTLTEPSSTDALQGRTATSEDCTIMSFTPFPVTESGDSEKIGVQLLSI